MTRGDFLNDLRRLTTGFNRSEGDLTPERVTALYEHFRHHSRDVWASAVTRCLMNDRYPTLAMLEEAVERAEDRERARRYESREGDARAVMLPDGTLASTSVTDPEWGKFCMEVTQGIREGVLSPPMLMAVLRRRASEFSAHGGLIGDWVHELHEFGNDWPHHYDRDYAKRDGRVVCVRCVAVMPDGRRVDVSPQ